MNLKRLIIIFILALSLLCGCGRTVVEEESDDTETFSNRSEETTDMFSLTFPVECFTSLTTDELLARGVKENETNAEIFFVFLDTPLCIYGKRHAATGPTTRHTDFFAYDKRTGTFSDACRDPLCDHTSCIWGMMDVLSYVYRGTDGLFFVYGDEEHSCIYATDFQGNNAKKIYEADDYVAPLKQLGNYLWFLQGIWNEEENREVDVLIRLDLETGRTVTVLRDDQDDFYDFSPLGGAVLYQPDVKGEDGGVAVHFPSYRLRDPDTGEDVLFLDGEGTNRDYTVAGVHDNALYYYSYVQEEQTFYLYRRGEGGYGKEELVAEASTATFSWTSGACYWWDRTDTGAVLYRENEEPYSIEVGECINRLVLDGDLLLCYYNIRDGFYHESHWLMINMKTGEQLDILLS